MSILKTITEVTRQGNSISIFTYYSNFTSLIKAFFSQYNQYINGVHFNQNDLGITKVGYDNIDFNIDSNGNLIASGDIADQFSIDSDGNLILTE